MKKKEVVNSIDTNYKECSLDIPSNAISLDVIDSSDFSNDTKRGTINRNNGKEKEVQSYNKDNTLHSYINLINKFPYLTQEREAQLLLNMLNGDERARDELIQSHLRLVVKTAFNYYRYGLPMIDLISEGNLGLISAINKFDISKGNRLSTYATWWIKAMIQAFILKSWSIVRIASSAAERNLFFNLQKIKQRLNLKRDSDLSNNDIEKVALMAGVSSKSVKQMESRFANADSSIDAPVLDGQVTLVDTMNSNEIDPADSLVNKLERSDFMDSFNNAMTSLNEREREILRCRLDKDMNGPSKVCTLEFLGNKFGISSERVRQIANRAMEKLREKMGNYKNSSEFIL